RDTCGETCADGFQEWSILPYLGMACHAGFDRWDIGERGVFDRGMAVAAIQPQSADMVLMAERYRLVVGDMLLCHIGRPVIHRHQTQQDERPQQEAEEAGSGKRIRKRMEGTRHQSYLVTLNSLRAIFITLPRVQKDRSLSALLPCQRGLDSPREGGEPPVKRLP